MIYAIRKKSCSKIKPPNHFGYTVHLISSLQCFTICVAQELGRELVSAICGNKLLIYVTKHALRSLPRRVGWHKCLSNNQHWLCSSTETKEWTVNSGLGCQWDVISHIWHNMNSGFADRHQSVNQVFSAVTPKKDQALSDVLRFFFHIIQGYLTSSQVPGRIWVNNW